MRRPLLAICLLQQIFIGLCLTQCCVAQEWPRFRGPQGQGIVALDLPVTFTEKNVAWRVAVGGTGHSSPVLWGDLLFLTRVNEPKGTREVVCYDASTGKQVWSYGSRFETHKQHKLNSFASATAAVDELAVYLMSTSGERLMAMAVNHRGELLWERDLGAYYAQHGSGNSPVVHGELVFIASENEGDDCFLMALDRQTGKSVWRHDLAKSPRWACYSPPFFYQPSKGKAVMLVASAAHGLTAYELATGGVRWQANPGFKNRFVAAPAVSGNKLLVNTGSGNSGKECVIFEMSEDAASEPKVSFRPRRGLPYVPSALAIEGRFFMFADSGFASCIDASSGEELWRERIDGHFFSSPVSNGESIYICDREGRLWTFSKEKFEVLGSFDLGAPICATPALARGAMFVRTADELIRLESVVGK